MESDWSAAQYLRFQNERTRPARDLADRIALAAPKNILDLGCGPGNSTQVLADKFPDAEITGIDRSPDMLAKAEKSCPNAVFRPADITPEADLQDSYDVIFSNACLQWIPEHRRLIPNLLRRLSPHGVLAVQIPETRDMPMNKILTGLSSEPEWRSKIAGVRNFHTLEPDEYFDLLSGISTNFSLWETVYFQTVDGIDGLIDWYRGSGLRPYLAALSEAEQTDFLREVGNRLGEFYQIRADGTILMRFPRLFFTAED